MPSSSDQVDENAPSTSEENASEAPPRVARKEELVGELEVLRTDLERLVNRIDANRPTPARAPPGVVAQAPAVPTNFRQAEQLLKAIDEEVARVDLLLAEVAQHERELRLKGFEEAGEPYRSAEFTLYARLAPRKGAEPLVKYFFAEEPPVNAVAVPLPDGYEVVTDPKTGKRSLRKTTSRSTS